MSPQTVHQFAEKVALVSDAGSRIGRAIALQLALQGSYVIGLFPQAASADEASVTELVELGTLAHGAAIDTSTSAGAGSAAETVNGLYGRLDLLINCLKYTPESSFETMTEPDFHAVVGKNLGSAYFLTQAVQKLMASRPKPKIVNLITAAESSAEPLFAATQAAVAGLTRSLAAILPAKFRTNCVQVAERQDASEASNELFLRTGSVAPDDVARAVLFLLSSESIGMNGEILRVG